MANDASTSSRSNYPERLSKRDVMSAGDVALMLGCPKGRVYDLVRRGELPGARRLGRTVIVVRPVFEHWLLSGEDPNRV